MNDAVPNDIRFERPGGLALTERMVRGLLPGSRVLDVGCGSGGSVLHMRTKLGLDTVGLDCDEAAFADADGAVAVRLFCGDAHALPFADGAFDAVLFECSLSKMDDPDRALAEAARVLCPDGRVAISDFFTMGHEQILSGVLGRMEMRGSWVKRLQAAGFEIEHQEDRTDDLRTLWGQMVFDHGLERLISIIYPDGQTLRGDETGYFLMIACKTAKRDDSQAEGGGQSVVPSPGTLDEGAVAKGDWGSATTQLNSLNNLELES